MNCGWKRYKIKGSTITTLVNIDNCGQWKHGEQLVHSEFGIVTIIGTSENGYCIPLLMRGKLCFTNEENRDYVIIVNDYAEFAMKVVELTVESVFRGAERRLIETLDIFQDNKNLDGLTEGNLQDLLELIEELHRNVQGIKPESKKLVSFSK